MIRYALNMHVPPGKFPFSHDSSLLFVGSCFSEHISGRLQECAWKVNAMPNGIVFNPLSLADPLQRLLDFRDYTEEDLVADNGLWHGKYHHGSFSEINESDALRKMNHRLHDFRRSLDKATHLFITFGTAWAYRYKSTGETFANCHRIPQDRFEKYLLTHDQVFEVWKAVLERWHQAYPDMKVVLTVSPVKHLRDGVVENNRSKSVLISAALDLVDQFDFTEYFPAYELVNDDLRDYRFYESDGAHPNALAIQYVFDRFCETYLDDPGKTYLKDMKEYLQMSRHKILKEDAEETRLFMSKLEAMRMRLNEIYGVDL